MLLVGLLFSTATQPALAGDFLTYQGRLTDASGNPVADGTYSLTFRLFNSLTGGTALWTDQFSSVQTKGGLFSVVLGSQATLDLGSFDDTTLYLQIQVGLALPLTPRVLLTSSPKAAVAGRVHGDLQTSAGKLMLKDTEGDSSIIMTAIPKRVDIQLFDPDPDPLNIRQVAMAIGVDSIKGANFQLFDPDPDPPGMSMYLQSGRTAGPSIMMFDPLTAVDGFPRMQFSSSPVDGVVLKMFDPQPEPPGKQFEINAPVAGIPSMMFFDHGSEVMGVEPSPFGGMAWRMFDPQPEPPGKMLEFLTQYGARTNSTSMTMYTVPLGGAEQELVTLTASGSTAEMRMGLGAPSGGTSALISMLSDGSTSEVKVIGAAFGPTTPPPVAIISDAAGAKIGIGTDAPSQALHVVGNICYTGTIGACSDSAFKKDIEPIEGALDAVDRLTGVRYRWDTEKFPEHRFSTDRQVGLIAQEVKEVVPEAVTLQSDGYYTVDYTRLTPVLLEAIKELQKQNQQLAKRIRILEERGQ
jgi:hypothetical protein